MKELQSRIETKCAELNAESVRNYPEAKVILEKYKKG